MTFLDNVAVGNAEIISKEKENNGCSSQSKCIPTPIEHYESSDCLGSAKMVSGTMHTYRTKREEQIAELRKLISFSPDPNVVTYANECLRIYDASNGFESVLSTDCEFLSHFRNWKIAAQHWKSLSVDEKHRLHMEHFDINLFESLSLWIDSFHNIKAPMTSVIGACEKPLKWFSDIFLEIYKDHHGKDMPTSELVMKFNDKYDLMYGMYTFWRDNREEYREKWLNRDKQKDILTRASHTYMSSQAFGDIPISKFLFVPAARFLLYDTLLGEIVPCLCQAIKILNASPTEKNVLLVYTLLHRVCFITGNTGYERANLFMLNQLILKKKSQPFLHEQMISNLRNVQSVILEYVHATLSGGVKEGSSKEDTTDELNKTIFSFPVIDESNLLMKERYNNRVKLSYVMTEKGIKYHSSIRKILDKYLKIKLPSLQREFEANSDPSVAEGFLPFMFDGKVFLANWSRDNDRTVGYHLSSFPAKYILWAANDAIIAEGAMEKEFKNFLKPTPSFDKIMFLQEMSRFSKEQKEKRLPFPDDLKSGSNRLFNSKASSVSLSPSTSRRVEERKNELTKTVGKKRKRDLSGDMKAKVLALPEVKPYLVSIDSKFKSFILGDPKCEAALEAIKLLSLGDYFQQSDKREFHRKVSKIINNNREQNKKKMKKT